MIARSLRLVGVVLTLFVGSAGPASAQLASRAAEEWIKTLDSPARVSAMKVGEVIAALKIVPGQAVGDIGAGSGAFSGPLALATGPQGVLYAVDIDKDLIAHIERRATEQKIGNIKVVLGAFSDPKLPAQVDLAFINDVLHHIEDRATYLRNLAGYLKPGGRIAIVDFMPGVPRTATSPSSRVRGTDRHVAEGRRPPLLGEDRAVRRPLLRVLREAVKPPTPAFIPQTFPESLALWHSRRAGVSGRSCAKGKVNALDPCVRSCCRGGHRAPHGRSTRQPAAAISSPTSRAVRIGLPSASPVHGRSSRSPAAHTRSPRHEPRRVPGTRRAISPRPSGTKGPRRRSSSAGGATRSACRRRRR